MLLKGELNTFNIYMHLIIIAAEILQNFQVEIQKKKAFELVAWED